MGNREAKKRYREWESELNQIILEWDTYSLYESAGQPDEFSFEVQKVLARLPRAVSESDVVMIVQQVFSEAFSADDFPREACSEVGERIWRWWQRRGPA